MKKLTPFLLFFIFLGACVNNESKLQNKISDLKSQNVELSTQVSKLKIRLEQYKLLTEMETAFNKKWYISVRTLFNKMKKLDTTTVEFKKSKPIYHKVMELIEDKKVETQRSINKELEKKNLIGYKTIKNIVQDKPKETQVILSAIIEPNSSIQKHQLKVLLNSIFKKILNKGDYVYHKKPNSIGIYLYTSKDKAESGMGQWVARLRYSMATGSEPKVDIQDVQFNSMAAKPVVKNGMPLSKRKQIWKEYINLEDKAQKVADRRFPTYGAGFKQGNVVKNMDYVKALIARYKKGLASKYKITESEIDAISNEAMSNGWPFPKY